MKHGTTRDFNVPPDHSHVQQLCNLHPRQEGQAFSALQVYQLIFSCPGVSINFPSTRILPGDDQAPHPPAAVPLRVTFTSGALPVPGRYNLKSWYGLYLHGHGATEGAPVSLKRSDRTADAQAWNLIYIGNGKHVLQSTHGSLLRGHASGSRVDLQKHTSCWERHTWEQWELAPSRDGRWKLISHHGTLLQALPPGSGTQQGSEGAVALAARGYRMAHVEWRLLPVQA